MYVEIGRVVVINYGELAGKVCVIIDIVDQARVSKNTHASAARTAGATMTRMQSASETTMANTAAC